MRSRSPATSRKKRRAINGRDVAVMRAQTRRRGGAARLRDAVARKFSSRAARENTNCCAWTRASKTARWRASRSWTCARTSARRIDAGPISERLRAAMAARLAAGTQSLVLINRRGYSWFALCRSCGASILCENCSIALTYHKRRDRLVCHYCGFSRRVPQALARNAPPNTFISSARAPSSSRSACARYFPRRASRGSIATPRAASAPSSRFWARLPTAGSTFWSGTQMVAKGHDFQRVTLVGVVSADAQLGFPGFPRRRAHLSVAHAGRRPRRPRRSAGRSAGGDALSGALRHPACGAAGLRRVLREGVALPPHAALSAVCGAG